MISTKQPRTAALLPYLEAGRAILSVVLGVAPEAVTVDPNDRVIGLGGCRLDLGSDLSLHDRLMISYGGKLATLRAFPHVDDLMRGDGGCDEPPLFEGLQQRASELVDEHWAAIDGVARLLAERGTVRGEDISACFLECARERWAAIEPQFQPHQ